MRDAPPYIPNSKQGEADKRQQLDSILDEATKRAEGQIGKIEQFMTFENASESDFDRAIGFAIRIRKAIFQTDSHITALCRIPVQYPAKVEKAASKPVAKTKAKGDQGNEPTRSDD